MTKRGKFITFEGPEGAGKTTQAKRLIVALQEHGNQVLYTREPGGTSTGEAIREILQYNKAGEPIAPETEVLLFAASRAQLVRKVILPALEQGIYVVCDRFADSTTAYQGYGRGFSVEQMITINQFAIDGAIPDVTILLDLEIAKGFDRLSRRHRDGRGQLDRIENEERAFHERVRRGYLEMAQKWPERFVVVNATGDEETVAGEVWRVVQGVLDR